MAILYQLLFLVNECDLQNNELVLWDEPETFAEPKLLSCPSSYMYVFVQTMAATAKLSINHTRRPD